MLKKLCRTALTSSVRTQYPIPPFPASKNQDGDIIVTFGYNAGRHIQILRPNASKMILLYFRFALKDKAKHVSDTVSSPKIILYY